MMDCLHLDMDSEKRVSEERANTCLEVLPIKEKWQWQLVVSNIDKFQ